MPLEADALNRHAGGEQILDEVVRGVALRTRELEVVVVVEQQRLGVGLVRPAEDVGDVLLAREAELLVGLGEDCLPRIPSRNPATPGPHRSSRCGSRADDRLRGGAPMGHHHQARFAAEYREQFGEKPSDTLGH